MGDRWSRFVDKLEKAEAKADAAAHRNPHGRCTWWCGDVECPAKCENPRPSPPGAKK